MNYLSRVDLGHLINVAKLNLTYKVILTKISYTLILPLAIKSARIWT